MTKFVYKFESIKKIKEIFEKKVRKEISSLENEIEKMNQKLNDILIEVDKTKNSFSDKRNIKASELQFFSEVQYLLELDIEKIRKEIARLEQLKQNKLNELAEKSKEHKMFEALEDKYQEDFISIQNRREQKDIDEMALTKYIRED